MEERYDPMDAMRRRSANRRKPSSMKRRFWYFMRRIVRQMAAVTDTENNAIEEAWEKYQSNNH